MRAAALAGGARIHCAPVEQRCARRAAPGVGLWAPRPSRWQRLTTRDTLFGATATNGSSQAEASEGPSTPQQQQQQQDPAIDAAAAGPSGSDSDDSNTAAAAAAAVRSHPLQIPEDPFGAEELVAELSDTASLGKRGEAFFAAQLLTMLFVLFPPFKLAGLFDLMATLALVSGIVFCVYGLISIGRYISPLPTPRKNHKLVTDGLFAYVRHPMYGGLVLASLGLAAITRSEGRLALALALWAVLERKIQFEEGCLLQRYGAEYKAYAARTKKLVPWLY